MKLARICYAVLIISLLAGCGSISVRDGHIPVNHAAKIKDLAGRYEGSIHLETFDGKNHTSLLEKTHLEFRITEAGEMILRPDEDWLGNDCGMRIGKLEEFRSLDQSDDRIFDARFEVDPGKCNDKVISHSLLLVSRIGTDGLPFLHTFLTKEHLSSNSRKASAGHLNYFGVFFKTP